MSAAEPIADLPLRFGWVTKDISITPLDSAGGFSGARLWKVATPQGEFCLRRWPPEHPSCERLAYIHDVLKHVTRHGFGLLPTPLEDRFGQSILTAAGSLWELTPWLPGIADFARRPSNERLIAAMTALAQFHQAAATYAPPTFSPSPGLVDRARQLHRLEQGEWEQLRAAVRPGDWPELYNVARQLFALVPAAVRKLAPPTALAATLALPLQPCIRDIWHDHVLFSGETVSGIVDFGALRPDNVAGDLARLIGSLVGDDPVRRGQAVEAYCRVRPLSNQEVPLIELFDRTTMLLGAMNWLRWIYIEQRTFTDRPRVVARLVELVRRLM